MADKVVCLCSQCFSLQKNIRLAQLPQLPERTVYRHLGRVGITAPFSRKGDVCNSGHVFVRLAPGAVADLTLHQYLHQQGIAPGEACKGLSLGCPSPDLRLTSLLAGPAQRAAGGQDHGGQDDGERAGSCATEAVRVSSC